MSDLRSCKSSDGNEMIAELIKSCIISIYIQIFIWNESKVTKLPQKAEKTIILIQKWVMLKIVQIISDTYF